MRSQDRATARRQLDKRLSRVPCADVFARPPRGWIKAIREALGMTTKQLAQRLGVVQSRIVAIEKAEVSGSITDNKHKLIRAYEVTSDEVHDSQKWVDVLFKNTSRDLWADSAYRSQANEEKLVAQGLRSHIHKKGQRNKPLSEAQQRANTRKSKVRVWVEHIFGAMTNEQGGLYFRVIGLARTATKIGLMNLVYNMRRLVQIDKLRASGV